LHPPRAEWQVAVRARNATGVVIVALAQKTEKLRVCGGLPDDPAPGTVRRKLLNREGLRHIPAPFGFDPIFVLAHE